MKKLLYFTVLVSLITAGCGGEKGKTVGDVRAEYTDYFKDLDAKLKAVAQRIETEPVDTNATCNLKEKLDFRYVSEGFNTDFLVQNEILDWQRTGGEGLGVEFSLSYVKHTMSDMTRAANPERDRDEDHNGDKEDKVKLLQRTKYFVIANRPMEQGVGWERSKMDFYIYNVQTNEIDCRFALIANSHSEEGVYEVKTYRGGSYQGSEYRSPGMEMERKEIRAAMDKYLEDSLGAILRK